MITIIYAQAGQKMPTRSKRVALLKTASPRVDNKFIVQDQGKPVFVKNDAAILHYSRQILTIGNAMQ